MPQYDMNISKSKSKLLLELLLIEENMDDSNMQEFMGAVFARNLGSRTFQIQNNIEVAGVFQ